MILGRVSLIAVALTAMAQHSLAQEPAPIADRLAGLWAAEQLFGPVAHGGLAIDARTPQWHAQIAGFDVPVERNGNEIRFHLPSDRGEFRGHLSIDAKAIHGHWIQPVSPIFFQSYATPVELPEIAKSVWRGEISPLQERISFYVSIHKGPDGITALVRNPEFGWFNARYQVRANDHAVTLKNQGGQLQGTFDASTDTLSFNLINGSRAPLVFTRRDNTNAAGFFPRLPHRHATYAYTLPLAENDGWATASLTKAQLDPKPISELLQSILDADPEIPRLSPSTAC